MLAWNPLLEIAFNDIGPSIGECIGPKAAIDHGNNSTDALVDSRDEERGAPQRSSLTGPEEDPSLSARHSGRPADQSGQTLPFLLVTLGSPSPSWRAADPDGSLIRSGRNTSISKPRLLGTLTATRPRPTSLSRSYGVGS